MNSSEDAENQQINDAWQKLKLWASQHGAIDLWLRDDDAGAVNSNLKRLCDIIKPHPICLAVIPTEITQELIGFIKENSHIFIAQHGYCHKNHAHVGEKKAEFLNHRPYQYLVEDARQGHELMQEYFSQQIKTSPTIFVPPWNRVTSRLVAELPSLGFKALSQHKSKMGENRHASSADFKVLDVRINLYEAEKGGFPRGAYILERILECATMSHQLSIAEPIGLLSHHQIMDEDCFNFMEFLIKRGIRENIIRIINPFNDL